MTPEKDDFAQFFAEQGMRCSISKHRFAYSAQKSQKISCRISNTMFHILHEIQQSRPFLISRKYEFKTQGCQWYGLRSQTD